MSTVLYSRFDKGEIPQLPRVTFPGKIVVVLDEAKAKKTVNYLLSKDIIGIDTETCPASKRRQRRRVTLLQACDHGVCFLLRSNLIGAPDCTKCFLEGTIVPKMGPFLSGDMLMLRQRLDFKPGYFIDPQGYAKLLSVGDMSPQKLYASVSQKHMTKRERLSSWESKILSDKQEIYAFADIWTYIKPYERLHELKHDGSYELVAVPPKVKPTPEEMGHVPEVTSE